MLVLMDLSAAFDLVNHKKLFDIRRVNFGVTGTALNWIKDYLQERHQVVVINGTQSKKFPIETRVPQGSCLGSVLFAAYAASILKVIGQHLVGIGGYADDNQVCSAFKPGHSSELYALSKMQDCIADIREWMSERELK